MKKLLIIIMFALLIGSLVLAQSSKVNKIGILGKGIAISATDPTVFQLVKIGAAEINLTTAEGEKTITVGILHLDNQTFRLRNIKIEVGYFSADIYLNGSYLGSIELSALLKEDTEVWVGKMNLNQEVWNIYLLEGKRQFRAAEKGEKIAEFCLNKPEECKPLAKGIGPAYCEKTPEDPSCREKIRNWCSQNENDPRCVALLRNYCRFNIEDTRCREQFRLICANNISTEACRYFQLKLTEIYCEKNPDNRRCVALEKKRIVDYCIDRPNEERCLRFRNTFEFMERARFASYCRNNTSEECVEFCSIHPIACMSPPQISNVTGVPMETVLRNVRNETLKRLRIGWSSA